MKVSAVIDTNVFIASVLSTNPHSASRAVIDRLLARSYVLVISSNALLELELVLAHPQIRAVHRLTDEEITRLCLDLLLTGQDFPGTTPVSSAHTRDLTDTKWVALAIESNADYLVTNDRRHLLRFRTIDRTRVVTPRKFLQELNRLA